MTPGNDPPVARLPFQIRPIAGEGGPSFITRLAHANQLPPAYLRKFLAKPPLHRGTPSWDRLAAVTGRDPDFLRTTLETRQCRECGIDLPPSSAFGRRAFLCSARCRMRISRKRYTKAPCRICQKPMKIQIGQRHRLCSSPCRRRAYLMRQGVLPAEGEEPPTDHACLACERPLPPDSHASRRTCSAPCRQQVIRWNQITEVEQLSEQFSTCAFCGTPIRSEHRTWPLRRWCSSRCRQRAYRRLDPTTYLRPLICELCSTSFERGPSGRASRWCSDRCRQRRYRRRAPTAYRGPLSCDHCQTLFELGPSGRARRWCSDSCRRQARPLLAAPTLRKTPRPQPVKTTTLHCLNCEHPFQGTASRSCPWCSTKCWSEALDQRSQQLACGICAISLSDRKPHDTRRWCSGACRQKAVRWRMELSTRGADTADQVPSQ